MSFFDRLKDIDPRIGYAALGIGGGVLIYAVVRRARSNVAASAKVPSLAELPGYPRSAPVIAKLEPVIRPYAEKLLVRAAQQQIPLVVTTGYRTMDEQEKLYAQGRTAPGDIVTNAKPGSSWHNFALAFDVAVMDSSGNPSWPTDSVLWSRIGQIGKEVGLEWGGDWQGFKDMPHFQYRGGLSLADARNGMRPSAAVV